MDYLRRINHLDQISVLGDKRRLFILRRLMKRPETLSSLGKAMGEHPARVRHHLKLLEKAGFVELVETRAVRGFIEKYYKARSQALLYHGLILTEDHYANSQVLVALGSNDPVVDMLAEQVNEQCGKQQIIVLPVGSLDGLIALRQGLAHLTGCHLYDPDSGTYNLPFVRLLFLDTPVRLITLTHREQGLLVPRGNPLGLQSVEDLTLPGVKLVNRNRGSGTRLWLESELARRGIAGESIDGFDSELSTHRDVAKTIASGQANAGLGLRAVAAPFGLDFIPLFKERYDLVVLQPVFESEAFAPVLDRLNSAEFREQVAQIEGYDPQEMGRIVA